jgi:hypothetical protein
MVDWIPVNVAGKSIVEILTHHQHPTFGAEKGGHAYTVHNIVNPHRVPWKDLIAMLRGSGILGKGGKLRQVSMVEWVGLLNKAADEGVSADELPALRLLGFFEHMAAGTNKSGNGIVFETAGSQAISPALAACQGYRAEWLAASVSRWKEDGFIQ